VISRVWEDTMEHCRSPDGVTSVSVRPYYAMLSRIYLALAMGFLVIMVLSITVLSLVSGNILQCFDTVGWVAGWASSL